MVIKVADFGIGMDEDQKARLIQKDRPARRKGTDGKNLLEWDYTLYRISCSSMEER